MKTEDLKALGLNDEQVQRVFAMNGADVNREKQAAETAKAERDAMRTQLDEANTKLKGYDPDWQQKAADAQKVADAKVAELQAGYAAQNAAAGLHFTSASAKKAFMADLAAKNLPLQGDSLLGFDDFVKTYRENDPGAFAADTKPPRIVASATGTPAAATGREDANAAFRAAFGKCKENNPCPMLLIVPALKPSSVSRLSAPFFRMPPSRAL